MDWSTRKNHGSKQLYYCRTHNEIASKSGLKQLKQLFMSCTSDILQALPLEIILRIVSYFEDQDIFSLGSAAKWYRDNIGSLSMKNDVIWKHLYHRTKFQIPIDFNVTVYFESFKKRVEVDSNWRQSRFKIKSAGDYTVVRSQRWGALYRNWMWNAAFK